MFAAKKMSVAQFERASASLPSCELVRGEISQQLPAGYFHNRSTMNLAFLLELWARKRRCGRIVTNEIGIVTQR